VLLLFGVALFTLFDSVEKRLAPLACRSGKDEAR